MTHASRSHARFAPSAAHRWVNCPGSVSLAEQFPNKSTPAADEGTAAHEIAERCLNKGWDVADRYEVGQEIEVRRGVKIRVTDEMIEGVQLYLDYIRKIFDECDEFAIESRLEISEVHADCYGTGDALGLNELEGVLHVADFKFGRKPVDPVENYQGLSYIIGALRKWARRRIKTIKVHIVQPRVSSTPLVWEITPVDVVRYAAQLRRAAEAADQPDALFSAGDWCDYCPAAAVCPTLRERAIRVAQDEFGVRADPTKLSRRELGGLLSELPILERWLDSVRSFALAEAMEGRSPEGHKLVMKRAVRRWKNPDETVTALRDVFDMQPDEIWDRKMKSPAQLEKLLDKTARKAMADLVLKVSSGVTLAPNSDKREAISPDAAAEFSKVEIEE